RDGHDRGVRHRLAGQVRAGPDAGRVPRLRRVRGIRIPRPRDRTAVAGHDRRLPLPGPGPDVVLREQGCVPLGGAHRDAQPGGVRDFDDLVINFTPGTLLILNVVLGLIMFGIALDTAPKDFKVVLKHPKPFNIAILAQLLLLPAVTFGLTLILPVSASMAL